MKPGGTGHEIHVPVLPEEVIEFLAPVSGGVYIDATAGAGGHILRILESAGPDGRVIGIDKDKEILAVTRERLGPFGDRVSLLHGDFREIESLAGSQGISGANGILFDLGFSTFQLETADRGFSYKEEGPLDMRLDRNSLLTAEAVINGYSPDELVRIFRDYSDERRPERVAEAVIEARSSRRITTTQELARVFRESSRGRKGTKFPEAALFQAVRIEVNDEFGAIRDGLEGAVHLLKPGGRLCVISFHSGEDRIVKRFMKSRKESMELKILTKKPVTPGKPEQVRNPKSRSAKLRAAERLGQA